MVRNFSTEEVDSLSGELVETTIAEDRNAARSKYQIRESPDCLIYDRSEEPQIYLYDLDDGGITHHRKLQNHIICFMIEGSLSAKFSDKTEFQLCKGQMAFIPSGNIYTWKFLEYAQLLVYRLQNPGFRLCEKFPVESLYTEDANILWPEQDKSPEDKSAPSKSMDNQQLSILNIHPRLLQRLKTVRDNIADGVRCKKFFELEIETFFILIRCYYEKKELYAFMRFIMTGNMIFTEYVRLRWNEHSSVSELASSMNMSTKHFSRTFVRYFGQKPSVWMANNRARLIFDELTASNKPLKQIASDNGFGSLSQFSIFTKRMLGKNPTEIRHGDETYPEN